MSTLRQQPPPRTSVDLIDNTWLHATVEALKKTHRQQSLSLSYRELLRVVASARGEIGFRPAEASIAAVAVDPESDAQRRFVDAISKAGIVVEEYDYRSTYVSVPGGLADRVDPPITSVVPQLSYALGLLARREKPEVVIVSGSFDFYWPLADFVARGGKAAICYFGMFIDRRWFSFGDLGHESQIGFIDLEPHGKDLIGLDLRAPTSTGARASKGIGSL